MLQALSSYEPKHAQRLLSKFVSTIIQPVSDPDKIKLTKDEEKIKNKLFLEIKKNKQLPSVSSSNEKVRIEILESLSDEISRLCYDFNDKSKIIELVGKAGELEPYQYKVDFSENYAENQKKLGITLELATETINYPDNYEHFLTKDFKNPGSFAHSIFTKRFYQSPQKGKSFICLVMCSRIDNIQRINNAWRIYPSIINFNQGLTPLEILSIFVEKFGLTLEIGNRVNKLFVNESIPIKGVKTKEPKIVDKKPKKFMISFDIQTVLETKMLIIGCAFAIDIEKYTNYLRTFRYSRIHNRTIRSR